MDRSRKGKNLCYMYAVGSHCKSVHGAKSEVEKVGIRAMYTVGSHCKSVVLKVYSVT